MYRLRAVFVAYKLEQNKEVEIITKFCTGEIYEMWYVVLVQSRWFKTKLSSQT